MFQIIKNKITSFHLPIRAVSRKSRRRRLLVLIIMIIFILPFVIRGLLLTRDTQAGWWPGNGNQWVKRKNLELFNTTGESLAATTSVAITVNTKELVASGKLRQDCADLRVLYQPNSGTATEVTRHLIFPVGESCATSETTKVYFPLQGTLGASSKSYDYYMYFANPDAVAPTDTDRAFDIGSKQALLVCPFNGTTECAAGETPSTETGAIRYGGAKSALSFAGMAYNNDYINSGSNSSLDNIFDNGATIDMWIKIDSIGNGHTTGFLLYKEEWRIYTSETGGKIRLTFQHNFSTTNGGWYTPGAITKNQWTHVVLIYNSSSASNVPSIFIDGQIQTLGTQITPAGTRSDDSSYNFCIASNCGGNGPIDGAVDELRISNVVRYTSNFTPQATPFVRDDNTVLLYHFDENGDDPRNTGKAIDDSGNGNHGTITGAKYVAGLVGIDSGSESGMTGEGNVPSQAYAGHEGIFIEEGTTNKVTNPSFEHATYDTSWTASGGTASENTTAPYYKFGSKSYKLVLADATDRTVLTSINVGNTNTHTLSAYVYRGTSGNVGGTVNATVAQLVFNGSAQTTTYTDVGGGWWRLTYSGAGVASAVNYGVQVNEDSGTLYIDGVQLEENPYQYVTSYADGSLGEGYSWTGTPNESTSIRAASEVTGYERTGNFSCEQGTISFWMKKQTAYPAVSEYYPRIFSLRTMTEDTIGFHQGYQGGNLTFGLTGYNPSYYGYSTQYNISGWALNSWHHVVGTYEENGDAILYVDGVQRNSTALGDLATDCGSTFEFKTTLQSSNRPGNQIIADLRSYNAPLTSDEIADLYQAGLVSHSQSYEVNRFSGDKGQDPLAIWHFDESYGSTAHDSSTYKHNLEISGASWNTQSVGARNRLVRNLQFDGTDDAATLQAGEAGNFNFGTGSFTLSGWFRHASTIDGTDTIMAKYNTAGYKVYMNSSGQLCFGIDDDSTWGPDDSACSTQSYADSKWHHFEAVYDSTGDVIPAQAGIHLFIDGLLVTSDTSLAATGSLSNSAPLTVGADSNNTDFWTGNLDEIIIYPYARSEEQVKTDFAGGQSSTYFGANQNDFMSDGLVGYWKMDEDTNQSRVDSSGNGNTLTQSAGDVIDAATGKFGSGADFENSSSENEYLYIDDASHTGLDLTGPMAISAWIKPESLPAGVHVIAAKLQDTSGGSSYMLALNGTMAEFAVYADATSASRVVAQGREQVTTTGMWYHLVGVYDGSTISIYVNAVLPPDLDGYISSKPYSGSIHDSTSSFTIGGRTNGSWYFDGVIDETRVYDRALSLVEIKALYDWAPGPVGYWDMNEGTGVTAYDKSGNNHHGTLESSTTWNVGKFGSAAYLNGSSDYISYTGIPTTQQDNWTMSAWVKPEDLTTLQIAVSNGTDDGVNGDGYGFGVNNDGTFVGVFSGVTFINSGYSFPSANQWYHLTMLRENGVTSFYVNGLQTTNTSSATPTTPTGFTIGSQTGIRYFNGAIDDVRIYNYPRTAEQIIEDMNAGHPAPGSPVGSALIHWKLDENGGTNVNNSGNGGSALMGTLSRGTWPTGCVLHGCIEFGSDGSVILNDPSFTDSLTEFTSSMWIRPTSLTTDSALIAKSTFVNNDHALLVRTDATNPDEIRVYIGSGSTTSDYFTTTDLDLTTSTWYHLTIVYNGSASAADRIKVYKNGLPVTGTVTGTIPSSMQASTAANFTIGDTNIGGVGVNDGLAASYDEIKFYTQAFSADQVKVEHNKGFATTLGTLSTTATGQADSSRDRKYCPPGNTETNCAAGLNASPTLEWTLDDNTGTSTVMDTAGNIWNDPKSGTMNGMTDSSWVSGVLGSALSFDGSDDYLSHVDHDDLDFTADVGLSLEAWVKHDTASAVETIISKYETTGTDAGYQLFMESNGEITCRVYRNNTLSGSDSATSTGLSYDDNRWHHVVCVKQPVSPFIAIYVDGVLVGTDTVRNNNTSLANNDSFYIGRNGDAAAYWKGQIDNVAVYRYARTQAQISWSYNRGGPVGWWRFDECAGTTAYDASGNGNNGTIVAGSGTYTTAGTCGGNTATEMWAAGATGKRNSGLGFDDVDDYVDIGNPTSLQLTRAMTVSAWVYHNPSDSNSRLVTKGSGSGNRGWELSYDAGSHYFYIAENSSSIITVSASDLIPSNTWVHVVGVYQPSQYLRIYVNGKLSGENTTSIPASMYNNAGETVKIGLRNDSTQRFGGKLDDVRIYNYALSETQVRTIMNNGVVRFGP